MAYIGNRPEQGNFRKCDAITTSATATYNLLVGGVAVNPNQNQCIVSLNGVIQSSGNSYSIASSQITFASALTSSDVIDFILILGDTLDVGTVSDDTIGLAQLSATGSPSSSNYLRGDNSWQTVSAGTSLSGSTDNTVTTVTGANAIQGEANLTFDGGTLTVKDDANGSTTETLVVTNGTSANPSYSNLVFKTGGNTSGCWIKGVQASGGNDGRLEFHTNNSGTVGEAMRINYQGKFGFGTSSIAHPFHFLYDQGGDAVMAVENSNNSNPQGIDLQFTAANPDNTSQYAIHFGSTAGSKFIVYSNGNVVNANNSYGSTSDNRLKENITDANSQWNDVKKLKFKNFNLINDSTSQLGVIAQDLENDGMSGLVDESPATKQAIAINSVFGTLYEDGDELPEGKNIGDVKTNLEDVKSVKYSVLLLKSAKALQEAITKIETLEAKVKALEDK
jgi:hypothetical protein